MGDLLPTFGTKSLDRHNLLIEDLISDVAILDCYACAKKLFIQFCKCIIIIIVKALTWNSLHLL